MKTPEEYKQATECRLALLDALDKKCAWDKGFMVDWKTQAARNKWKRIMDQQIADEIEQGM